MSAQRPGNPYKRCADCGVRHNPDRACSPNAPAAVGAAGAGDGKYHDAPFLKKFGS